MPTRKMIFIGIAVAVVVTSIVVIVSLTAGRPESQQNEYVKDNLSLKQKLAEYNILMSSPIRLQKAEDIEKYCNLFTSEEKQRQVLYCTSTEIKDKDGNFLGNIHMVGTPQKPSTIITLIQTDFTMSQIESVKTIFHTVIKQTVCDCWEKVQPDKFKTVSDWIDGLRKFHSADKEAHSRSKPIILASKQIHMELSKNNQGYLWQLFIQSPQ